MVDLIIALVIFMLSWSLITGRFRNPGGGAASNERQSQHAPAPECADKSWRAPIRGDHRVLIRYADFEGNRTERVVRPIRLHGKPDTGRKSAFAFFAFCETRKDIRQFRVDRVEAAFDANTGEEIVNLREALMDWTEA